MKCELCRQENALRNYSLCSSCAEMVQRLITLKDQLRKPDANDSPRAAGAAVAGIYR